MALTRKKFLIAKIESTYGTDPNPVGGADAVQVTNVEVTPIESDNVQAAAYQGFIGNSTRGTLVANKRVAITFDVELGGSGAAGTAPAFGPLAEVLRSVRDHCCFYQRHLCRREQQLRLCDDLLLLRRHPSQDHWLPVARLSFNFTAGQFAVASFQLHRDLQRS